jgi:Protein of unknown function (DUF2569)
MSSISYNRDKKIGGWLFVLIIWFAFWITDQNNGTIKFYKNIYSQNEDYFDKNILATSIYHFLYYSIWAISIASVYCAYLLAFKKKYAKSVSKNSLVFIFVLMIIKCAIYYVMLIKNNGISLPLLIGSIGLLVQPALAAVWFIYLKKSKRVEETYLN